MSEPYKVLRMKYKVYFYFLFIDLMSCSVFGRIWGVLEGFWLVQIVDLVGAFPDLVGRTLIIEGWRNELAYLVYGWPADGLFGMTTYVVVSRANAAYL